MSDTFINIHDVTAVLIAPAREDTRGAVQTIKIRTKSGVVELALFADTALQLAHRIVDSDHATG